MKVFNMVTSSHISLDFITMKILILYRNHMNIRNVVRFLDIIVISCGKEHILEINRTSMVKVINPVHNIIISEYMKENIGEKHYECNQCGKPFS